MKNFNDLLDEMRDTRPGGGGTHYTTPEVNRAVRQGLVAAAFSAIRHYKNTSPKFIIGKMGWTAGGTEDMQYYDGIQGNAKIITELIMEGFIALNKDGMLFIIGD